MIDEDKVTRLVKEWILQHGQTPDVACIDDHVNLLDTGVLDSMGFIELLEYIQSVTGYRIDLLEVDPSAFTSIRGLIRNLDGTMKAE